MTSSSSRSDLLGGLAWIGFGIVILIESLRMDRFTKMGVSLYTMPGFVPGILGAVIVALGAALIWRSWRRMTVHGQVEALVQEKSDSLFNQRILIALPLCLVYAAGLVGRVPFWLATALFIAVFTYCFAPKELTQTKRMLAALTSGVITTAVVIGVFQYVFLVRLP
jgi:Tripartite tricarboxylate transporter TctB family